MSIIIAIICLMGIGYCIWAIFTRKGTAFTQQQKEKQKTLNQRNKTPANNANPISTNTTNDNLWIIYQKDNGETSYRHIQVNSITSNEFGDLYCSAFDLDKNVERTFKLSRIRAVGYKKKSRQFETHQQILDALHQCELIGSPVKYLIHYTAENGTPSERAVIIRELKQSSNNDWYIHAQDMTDYQTLSFRVDRVQSLNSGHTIYSTTDDIFRELQGLG